jgi:chromosome segregation ATPase
MSDFKGSKMSSISSLKDRSNDLKSKAEQRASEWESINKQIAEAMQGVRDVRVLGALENARSEMNVEFQSEMADIQSDADQVNDEIQTEIDDIQVERDSLADSKNDLSAAGSISDLGSDVISQANNELSDEDRELLELIQDANDTSKNLSESMRSNSNRIR